MANITVSTNSGHDIAVLCIDDESGPGGDFRTWELHEITIGILTEVALAIDEIEATDALVQEVIGPLAASLVVDMLATLDEDFS